MSRAETFFERAHGQDEYFSYNEVQLRTERISSVDVADVDITGQITTHYSLKVPILGAAMNTISEDEMAIAMGLLGGGAIVHHANTPEEQQELVQNVYHFLNGIIPKPIVTKEGETVADTLEMLDKKGKRGKSFRVLPVIDNEGHCIGLMDKTSFNLFDSQTPVEEAMRPFGTFETADADTTPEQAYEIMRAGRHSVLVLLNAAREIGGLCLDKDIGRMIHSDPGQYSLREDGRLMTFASVPTIPSEAIERVRLMSKYLNVVVIDTSHGEHSHAIETLVALKEAYAYETYGIDFVAGNISTEQAASEIAKYEPDAMQAGQGPGQICISSDRLGFGTPQASAVYEVAKGARQVNPEMPIIADGGIADSADTMKAFAIGATAVKVGGLIAATSETPVETQRNAEGTLYRDYYGMGSKKAQEAFAAARARYGNYSPLRRIFVEGFEKEVPLKGPVTDVIEDHVLGIKISMAAQGAKDLRDLAEHASFMRGSNKKS